MAVPASAVVQVQGADLRSACFYFAGSLLSGWKARLGVRQRLLQNIVQPLPASSADRSVPDSVRDTRLPRVSSASSMSFLSGCFSPLKKSLILYLNLSSFCKGRNILPFT